MSILKTLLIIFVILVLIKLGLDFSENLFVLREGMHNKDTNKKDDKIENIPTPHTQKRVNDARVVPDDSINHKYKKYIPANLDELPLKTAQLKKMGRDFLLNEGQKRKKELTVNDEDAKIIGRMVWSVYTAEVEQKRSGSPKSHDELVVRETQLIDKVNSLLKNGKKLMVDNQAANVESDGITKDHTTKQTNNMFTDIPQTHSRHTHPVTKSDYLPIVSIGAPLDPNAYPRPYDSLMSLFK